MILLNHQTPGPNYPCSTDDQCGLVAVEYDEVVYAAITWATASGIVVVESAGNGHQNLDAPEYGDTFNTTTGRPDSGAIIVGGGASPADCEEKSGRPARSRLDSSNYGEFVDAQGWGECSSAAPIVAGAAAAYSSAIEATIGTRPTSWQVRQALVSTGTPQDTTSQNALEGDIGPLPNLLAALALIGTDADITPPTVTAPIQTIATGKAGSTVPIRVRWSATDAGGIKSYELWRSTNGGKFVRDTTVSPTATSRTYLLTVGKSYRFFVRAHDNAGNTSAAEYGPTFTPTVTDDRSCCRYVARGGSWIRESWSQAYMGTLTTLHTGVTGAGGYRSVYVHGSRRGLRRLAWQQPQVRNGHNRRRFRLQGESPPGRRRRRADRDLEALGDLGHAHDRSRGGGCRCNRRRRVRGEQVGGNYPEPGLPAPPGEDK